MTDHDHSPRLVIVIGANGAGKTTWSRSNRHLLPKPFYNADSIAEGLGDPDDPSLQANARRIVDVAIEQDLLDRRSCGFESTYSGSSRPAVVRRSIALSYSAHAFFIGTETHEINVARVAKRVSEGGHHVPAEEIVRRWTAAQENLLETWPCFQTITIIDNSGSAPLVAAEQRGPSLRPQTGSIDWVQHLLARVPRTPTRQRERS